MLLQWKDITDFTLTCMCLLHPAAWYLIFGAILGHSLPFAAMGNATVRYSNVSLSVLRCGGPCKNKVNLGKFTAFLLFW